MITFIQRDYLDQPDIGFAFLPAYRQYALEVTKAVLEQVKKKASCPRILATSKKENIKSIQLLEKLGFKFDKEIQTENEFLLLYTLPINHLKLDS